MELIDYKFNKNLWDEYYKELVEIEIAEYTSKELKLIMKGVEII